MSHKPLAPLAPLVGGGDAVFRSIKIASPAASLQAPQKLSITHYLQNPSLLESENWDHIKTLGYPNGVPGWSPAPPDPPKASSGTVDVDAASFRVVQVTPFIRPESLTQFPCPGMKVEEVLAALKSGLRDVGCYFEVSAAAGELRIGDIVDGQRVGGVACIYDMSGASTHHYYHQQQQISGSGSGSSTSTTSSTTGRAADLALVFLRRHGEERACARLFYQVIIASRLAPDVQMPKLLAARRLCVGCFDGCFPPVDGADGRDAVDGGHPPAAVDQGDIFIDMIGSKFDDDATTAARALAQTACSCCDGDSRVCLAPAAYLPNLVQVVEAYKRHAEAAYSGAAAAAPMATTAATTPTPLSFIPTSPVPASQDIAVSLAAFLGDVAAAAAKKGLLRDEHLAVLGDRAVVGPLLWCCGSGGGGVANGAGFGGDGVQLDPLGARAYLRSVAQLCEAHPKLLAALNADGQAFKAACAIEQDPFLGRYAAAARKKIEAAVAAAML